ncbi:hypothetical protein QQ045_007179 [Rhodiola kirilowii]
MDKDEPDVSLTRSIDVDDDDLHEAAFSKRGCCFWVPFFSGSGQRDDGSAMWERIRTGEEEGSNKWWRKALKAAMKVREWSELVAGPKWKTFIRRFNKNRTGNQRSGPRKFNYDPVDYAKNFDDGGVDSDDEDVLRRGFSLRYASVPHSAKSSMDLGKDGPVFE